LLIKNERIDVVDLDGDLSLLEEELELLPVVLFLCIGLSIVERMHLNFLREISGEYLSNEEAVIEGPTHVLDGVGQVQGLQPFEDFTRKASWSSVGICELAI